MSQNFDNYPSGFEGEELAMTYANRRAEELAKTRKRNMASNIVLGVSALGFAVFTFTTGNFLFTLPFFVWAGWNVETFFKQK